MSQFKLFKILPMFFFLLLISSTIAADEANCGEEVAVTELIRMCNYGGAEIVSGSTVCDNSAITLYMGSGCDDGLVMKIHLVNLLGFDQEPSGSGPYSLPVGMPNLHVEYDSDFDGVYDVITAPINDFYYNGESVPSIHGNQRHYLFEHELILSELFSSDEACLPGSPPIEDFDLVIVRLSQINDGISQMYDFANYAGPFDVASCEVFHETCQFCDPTCSKNGPVYEVDICVDCITSCSAETKSEQIEEAFLTKTVLHNITPNPFQDKVELQFTTATEEILMVEVIDIRGVVLQRQSITSTIGRQRTTLDLSKLSKGVYYCRFQSASGIEVEKIIKSK